MIHVRAALGRAPFRVVLQKFDVEPVQAAGGPDVEGAVADLFDGRDPGKREEETEMVWEVAIGAGDRLAARQILGLEGVSIRCQNVFGFGPGGRLAGLERGERLSDLAGSGDGDMDVIGLKDTAKVGLIRLALTQAFNRRFLVAEGLEEGEGELLGAERLFGEGGYGLLDC